MIDSKEDTPMESKCCDSPVYTDRIDGGTYCTVCDRNQAEEAGD